MFLVFIGRINLNKSLGPNDLHPKLLFELCKIIAKPSAKLHTLAFNFGLIPNYWKLADVTLLKKVQKVNVKITDSQV